MDTSPIHNFVQRTLLIAVFSLTMIACSRPATWTGSLDQLLASQPARFGTVMENPEQFRVQIIYTQIDRDASNTPTFTSHSFRLDESEYFYPASTIKLPTSLIALETLRGLADAGVTRDTPMVIEDPDAVEMSSALPANTQPASPTTIAQDVERILIVSDNDAYNRLYEFVGYERLNHALPELGLTGTRIVHKLETAASEIENRRTHAVRFVEAGQTLYAQDESVGSSIYAAEAPITLGKGEIIGESLTTGPKDFSGKNAYPLQAQHDLLIALMFPESILPERRLRISEDDLRFVREAMSTYPASSGYPEYSDQTEFPDGFVKFLMYGGNEAVIPDHIRIFNKSGQAYGFLTDAAYIVDLKNGVEFILAATIYTNANGIFNDDLYEYDSIGFPFMRELGKAIYELELARDRAVRPDLLAFDLR